MVTRHCNILVIYSLLESKISRCNIKYILSDFHFCPLFTLDSSFLYIFLALSYEAGIDAPACETPRKNGQKRGVLAGQNQGDILKSFKFRKATMKQYDNNEQ